MAIDSTSTITTIVKFASDTLFTKPITDSFQSASSIATLLRDQAGWIVAVVAIYITLITTRFQSISGFRQDWIDNLRLALADFRTAIGRYQIHLLNIRTLPELQQQELYTQAVNLSFRIRLFLNPEEPHSKEMMSLLDIMMSMFGSNLSQAEKQIEIENALGRFVPLSQIILKKEWKRNKSLWRYLLLVS